MESQYKEANRSVMDLSDNKKYKTTSSGSGRIADMNGFGDVVKARHFGKEPADVYVRRIMEQDPFCEIRENLLDSESDDF